MQGWGWCWYGGLSRVGRWVGLGFSFYLWLGSGWVYGKCLNLWLRFSFSFFLVLGLGWG